MNRTEEKRTANFLWNTRHDLYNYFRKVYGVSREEVDAAIDTAKVNFTLRRNQAINTRELWQKAGMSLEKKLRPRTGT